MIPFWHPDKLAPGTITSIGFYFKPLENPQSCVIIKEITHKEYRKLALELYPDYPQSYSIPGFTYLVSTD